MSALSLTNRRAHDNYPQSRIQLRCQFDRFGRHVRAETLVPARSHCALFSNPRLLKLGKVRCPGFLFSIAYEGQVDQPFEIVAEIFLCGYAARGSSSRSAIYGRTVERMRSEIGPSVVRN